MDFFVHSDDDPTKVRLLFPHGRFPTSASENDDPCPRSGPVQLGRDPGKALVTYGGGFVAEIVRLPQASRAKSTSLLVLPQAAPMAATANRWAVVSIQGHAKHTPGTERTL